MLHLLFTQMGNISLSTSINILKKTVSKTEREHSCNQNIIRVKVDWLSHFSCHNSLSTTKNRNIVRYIYHRIPSGKLIFTLKHCFPGCGLFLDSGTYHDRFLACVSTHQYKTQRPASLEKRIVKSHTPPLLRDLITNHIDNYYNSNIKHDFPGIHNTCSTDGCV